MGKDNFVSDQESSSMGEAAFEPKSESWSSWFCRHGLQIVKGTAIVGLLALGAGFCYWLGKRSGASSASSSSNALVESTSALVSDTTPTPVSLVGGAGAGKLLNFEDGKTTQKIEFGDAAAEQKNAAAMSSSSATSQRVSAKSAEGQNVETAVGTTAVNNLVVNGTIPDQLIQVGFPWIGGSINMTELFGERVNIAGFSQVAGDKVFPDWLQIAPNLVGSVSGFWAQGVTVSGNLAYVTAYYGQGLKIIDISNSSNPQVIEPGVPGFDARSVAVSGNLAYVAASCKILPCAEGEGGLKIIDISNSSSPFVISGVPGFTANSVTVSGNLAYVAAQTQGLKIIDISDSSSPFVRSSVLGFDARDNAISGNLAYVAAGFQGLKIIDISNSSNPQVIEPGVAGLKAQGITVRGNLAYIVADYGQGLKIIDISNSGSPKVIEPGVQGFSAYDITVRGNLAYVADIFPGGLKIIDIGKSGSPKVIEPGVQGFSAYGITISGNLAYVAAWNQGLKIIDLSQWQLSGSPTQSKCFYQFAITVENSHGNATKIFSAKTDYFPYATGTISDQSLNPNSFLSLAIKLTDIFHDQDRGDTLFLSWRSGVSSRPAWLKLEIEPFFMTRKTGFYSTAFGITISSNLAYVAAYTDGFKIIDISNSGSPKVIEPGVQGFYPFGVTVSGNLAYVASSDGFKIIDISNSGSPKIIEPGVRGFDARGVTISGNLAYVVAVNNQGLKIIDVSDSSSPHVIEPGVGGFTASGVTVSGNLAYVATGVGLKIIDISNSSSPFVRSGVPGFWAQGVTVRGNLAYVAVLANQGLKIIDVSNSSSPFVRSDVPGFDAQGVIISGNLAYVTASEGLKIIDVSRPDNPTIVGEVSGTTYGVAVLPVKNTVCTVGSTFSILDLTNYKFSGTPANSDAGNYPITVTATDPDGAAAQTKFTIRVEGGPRLSSNVTIPSQIAQVGRTAIFFLEQGTFYDPNNDVITYASNLASGDKLPDFLSFNPSSATFTAVPTLDDRGKYLITIFASDRIVYPPTPVNFTLVVQDPIPEQVFIVGRNNTTPVLPIPADSTFEGRSLVYDVKPRNTKTLPDWLRFDADKRTLSGNPNATAVNLITMQVTLNDGYGEAFALFNLRVKFNTPPVLSSMIPDQAVSAGNYFHLTFRDDTFTDADGDSLKYAVGLGSASRWLTFNAENRTFSGTPNGWTDAYPYFARTYTITINATDPSNATATGIFNVNLSGSHWTTLITAATVVLGTMATSYAYAQKKHLLWDFFKKSKYRKPPELLALRDTEFSHKISFPAEHIKSIIVTVSRDRSCAGKMLPCCKKTLGFFPMLESAVSDIEVRTFPCNSVYLFPWLFYDAETNTLKSVKGGPTASEVGKDIKIQVRGTDNRIMEEFHIKVQSIRNEIAEIADREVKRRESTHVRPYIPALPVEHKAEHRAGAALETPLLAPTADVS